MGMKYTQMPADAFEKLQLNAGILTKTFTPATGVIGAIMGATSGGMTFTAVPSFKDYGEDLDNCPANMLELKKLIDYVATMAGTFKSVDANLAKDLIGSADIDSEDTTKIVPRQTLEKEDFSDVWWVGDYSDKNTGDSAGFIAIHLINALNTSGISIKSTDEGKGEFAFNFVGHYTLEDQNRVPFEIYIKAGA